MKKIVFSALWLLLTNTSFGQQQIPSASFTKQDYLRKSKNQKTAAWILLGGGVVLIGTGAAISSSGESSFDDAATGVVMAGAGVLAGLGSIPLFIASGRNKRKGLALSFKNELFQQIKNNGIVYSPMPAVSIKIRI